MGGEKNSCAFLQALGSPATDAPWPLPNYKCFFAQKNLVVIAFNVSKLNSHQQRSMGKGDRTQSVAEVPWAVLSSRSWQYHLYCAICNCSVTAEVTGAQRGLAPSLSCRVQLIGISRGGVSCLHPERDWECRPAPPAPPPSPVPCRAVCPCCIALYLQRLLGFLPVTRCGQGNIPPPPVLHSLASVFLLFSSSCLCSCWLWPGPVTGQDVLLLRRYRHANKLHCLWNFSGHWR